MAQALVPISLRLAPEELEALRKLVARRMLTGQKSSVNEVVRDLIRQASADATS